MTSPVINLAQALISRPSLTPNDAGCLDLIGQRLANVGFTIERMPFGDTDNLWAWHGDNKGPTLMFAGHTDVVPVGDPELWHSPPFEPVIRNDLLYGRGAADMKGALAAMVIAAEEFVSAEPGHKGRIAFLLTSDEEGSATNGTVKVVQALMDRQEQVDYCLVGEPSCSHCFGDTIKNGRRGSLTVDLTIFGIQGHVAYPHLAYNPIHGFLPALQELTERMWDQGNLFFPPTSMQVTQIKAGTGANNVIPGQLTVQINFRFSTELDEARIRQQLEEVLERYQLQYHGQWRLSGEPFLTASGKLIEVLQASIQKHTGMTAELLTTGGTSDGRFIVKMGAQVAEFGPLNNTIHQINECVSVSDLQQLNRIYHSLIVGLLA